MTETYRHEYKIKYCCIWLQPENILLFFNTKLEDLPFLTVHVKLSFLDTTLFHAVLSWLLSGC